MKKMSLLLVASFISSLVLPGQIFAQKKDNSSYFAACHKEAGRKNSLRRMGPGEMYPALQGGPELGSAVIEPNEDVVAGSFGTWEIIYTAGKAGLDTTDALNIYFPYGFNPPLLHYPTFPGDVIPNYNQERSKSFSPGLTTVRSTNPDTRLILYTSIWDYSRQSEGTNLYIGISGAPLKEGDKIIVLYGNTRYGGPGASVAYFAQDHEFTTFVLKNVDWEKFEDLTNKIKKLRIQLCTAAEKIYCIENPPALHVIGGKAVKLAFTVPSLVSVDEPFDLHIRPMDRLGNESKGYTGRLTFESSAVTQLPETFRVDNPEKEFIRISGGGKISKPGVYYLVVKDEEKGFAAESNPIKVVPEKGGGKIFWGDLHVHSYESDGIGSPDHNNRFCRDIAALDYCCICDHASGVFKEIRESAIKFTEPGRFISFSGYEGLASEIPGGGHVNFYFADDSPDYEKVMKPLLELGNKYTSRHQLWERLLGFGEKKVIAVPHNHNGGGWHDMDSPVVRCDEIYSVWGNSEFTAGPEKAYLFGQTGYRTFQQALAAGLRLGCIGGGDEHAGRGGTGTWLRHFKSNTAGISASYSRTLTKEGIFNSLWDRAVYATTGARIIVDFSINGYPMGSEFYVNSPGEIRNIKAEIEGTDKIKYVAVIKNNGELVNRIGSGRSMKIELSDDKPVGRTDFYYVRAVQEDGHLAWSSSVWVSVK
ncbi:MAG TPA: hypothetical protein VM123_18500 [archaeon]|nr:hypothetical protein [archaeon]